jgi:hypothetical protein
MSDAFPIQNGLKQGDVLSQLLFNCDLEYANMEAKENQEELKLSGTRQLLVSADEFNILGENVNTVKKNTEALIKTSKEGRLEVNTKKTQCVVMFCH